MELLLLIICGSDRDGVQSCVYKHGVTPKLDALVRQRLNEKRPEHKRCVGGNFEVRENFCALKMNDYMSRSLMWFLSVDLQREDFNLMVFTEGHSDASFKQREANQI